MKTSMKAIVAVVLIGSAAWFVAQAQDGPGGGQRGERGERGQGGPGGMGGRRPLPPIMAVLDADKDGVIDATEIANASKALLKLDKNGDGKLTQDELRPARPQGDGQDGPPRQQ